MEGVLTCSELQEIGAFLAPIVLEPPWDVATTCLQDLGTWQQLGISVTPTAGLISAVCLHSCSACSPPPPPPRGECVDHDMNWNGIIMALAGSAEADGSNVPVPASETCPDLMVCATTRPSPKQCTLIVYVAYVPWQDWRPFIGASQYSMEDVCKIELRSIATTSSNPYHSTLESYYTPPEGFEELSIGHVCALTCGFGMCPPSPPVPPPSVPPPPNVCGSPEDVLAESIADVSMEANLRDERLQAGDGRAHVPAWANTARPSACARGTR